MAMPGRSNLSGPFKNDEICADLSQTSADRKSCGTSADHGNVCPFRHLLRPLLTLLEHSPLRLSQPPLP
jgi:hypothetical protein